MSLAVALDNFLDFVVPFLDENGKGILEWQETQQLKALDGEVLVQRAIFDRPEKIQRIWQAIESIPPFSATGLEKLPGTGLLHSPDTGGTNIYANGNWMKCIKAMWATAEEKKPKQEGKGTVKGAAKKRSGGRKRLEQKNPLKLQVYDRINAERQNGVGPKAIFVWLKDDKDFVQQVKDAGLGKFTPKIVKNAIACFDDRKREASKKQETESN